MGLTNAWRDGIAAAWIGGSFTTFSNSNARLSVGDSSTAFAASQTDLQAGSNKLRKAMDATYPTQVANVVTFQSTFTGSEANWQWNEWGIHNAASSGIMSNRKVETFGTKASPAVWTLQVAVTLGV